MLTNKQPTPLAGIQTTLCPPRHSVDFAWILFLPRLPLMLPRSLIYSFNILT